MQLGRLAAELCCRDREPAEIRLLSDPDDRGATHPNERKAELRSYRRLSESLRKRYAPALHLLLLRPAPDDLCVRRSPATQEVALPLLRVEQRHVAVG